MKIINVKSYDELIKFIQENNATLTTDRNENIFIHLKDSSTKTSN